MRYSIHEVYGKILDLSENGSLYWTRFIWNACVVPKHAFITWLANLNRLKTRDRLHHMGITNSSDCLICDTATEDTFHLFFSCCYSRKCTIEVKLWLDWHSSSENLQGLLRWLARGKGLSRFRKRIFASSLATTTYHLWRVQNLALWEEKFQSVDCTVRHIKRDIKTRGYNFVKNSVSELDKIWFGDLVV
ncbi:uncharacterized protein LOC133799898 [Humulus lupulus]|uniref:uncharacterized protein LOC133799898 n=1 Tax=Humulus lupulus TaxID=3486 RepID=UPI002B404CEB|nr:uncharacterized protein LOC133799898 [Humulus lupulus]